MNFAHAAPLTNQPTDRASQQATNEPIQWTTLCSKLRYWRFRKPLDDDDKFSEKVFLIANTLNHRIADYYVVNSQNTWIGKYFRSGLVWFVLVSSSLCSVAPKTRTSSGMGWKHFSFENLCIQANCNKCILFIFWQCECITKPIYLLHYISLEWTSLQQQKSHEPQSFSGKINRWDEQNNHRSCEYCRASIYHVTMLRTK